MYQDSGWGQRAAMVRSQWVRYRGGALSVIYIIHHLLLLFVLPACIFIFVFGAGGTLIDPAKAYETWNWWRIYGYIFAVFAPSIGEYYLYQERKVTFSSSSQDTVSFYNRQSINVIWGVWMVMITILGLWSGLLTVWLGVTDFANCANSAICGGASGSSSPSTGIIMLIVSMGLSTLVFVVLFLGGLYVHSAARDAFAARITGTAPLMNQIGAERPIVQEARQHLEKEPDLAVQLLNAPLEWVARTFPFFGRGEWVEDENEPEQPRARVPSLLSGETSL